MINTAAVHARMDRETKDAAEGVLREIGMSPTDAIRLLYRQIALRGEFPVELRVPNSVTAKTLIDSDNGIGIEDFDSLDDIKFSSDDA